MKFPVKYKDHVATNMSQKSKSDDAIIDKENGEKSDNVINGRITDGVSKRDKESLVKVDCQNWNVSNSTKVHIVNSDSTSLNNNVDTTNNECMNSNVDNCGKDDGNKETIECSSNKDRNEIMDKNKPENLPNSYATIVKSNGNVDDNKLEFIPPELADNDSEW